MIWICTASPYFQRRTHPHRTSFISGDKRRQEDWQSSASGRSRTQRPHLAAPHGPRAEPTPGAENHAEAGAGGVRAAGLPGRARPAKGFLPVRRPNGERGGSLGELHAHLRSPRASRRRGALPHQPSAQRRPRSPTLRGPDPAHAQPLCWRGRGPGGGGRGAGGAGTLRRPGDGRGLPTCEVRPCSSSSWPLRTRRSFSMALLPGRSGAHSPARRPLAHSEETGTGDSSR